MTQQHSPLSPASTASTASTANSLYQPDDEASANKRRKVEKYRLYVELPHPSPHQHASKVKRALLRALSSGELVLPHSKVNRQWLSQCLSRPVVDARMEPAMEWEVHVYACHPPTPPSPPPTKTQQPRSLSTTEKEQVSILTYAMPNEKFRHSWPQLLYSSPLKQELLNYVSLLFHANDLQLDAGVMAFHHLLLLHGEAGTGKSSLCRGLAQELSIRHAQRKVVMMELHANSLFSRYFSESSKRLIQMFERIHGMMREGVFVVLVVDEVESLVSSRVASNEPSDAMRVVNTLLTQLDGLQGFSNCLVLTTSNLLDKVDAAFLSRADLVMEVPVQGWRVNYQLLARGVRELVKTGLIAPRSVSVCELSELSEGNEISLRLKELAHASHGLSARALSKLPLRILIRNSRPVHVDDYLDSMTKIIGELKQ